MQISRPSTQFSPEPILLASKGNLSVTLHYFERENDISSERIEFQTVRAYRKVSEPFCEAWHYNLGYDCVTGMSKSAWLDEIADRERRPGLQTRHFVVAFDSWGCLEVLASSAALVPNTDVT